MANKIIGAVSAPRFIIQGPKANPCPEHFECGCNLYWSNAWGWGSKQGATEFAPAEIATVNLPYEWVSLRLVQS